MLYFLLILSILFASVSLGQGENAIYDPVLIDIEEGNLRVEKWSQFLEELSADKPLSAYDLEQLAILVSSNSPKDYSRDRSRSVEIHELHKEGLTRLLEHKGHAEYFADKIVSIHKELERDEINWPLAWSRVHHPMRSLKSMPSHESVVELTKLLDMQSNWFGNRFFGREQILFNGQTPDDQSESFAGMAASALYELGIEGGAPKEGELQNGQIVWLGDGLGADFLVDEWKKWWQEVVDGKRTFGFEGDPKRYNHLGVVEVQTSPRQEIKIGKTSSYRPSFERPGASRTVEKEAVYFKWIYMFLGVVILGGLGILAWNQWKGSSAR